MKNLTEINIWKQNLGLLPIHLKPENPSEYVMLNGGYGDFCLKTAESEESIKNYHSKAWSSNTKNYLVLENDNVTIFNWLKDKPEVIPQNLIAENFEKFYNYLLSKSYKSSKDVVPYIIDIFRQFRNLTLENSNPVEALNLLFILLTSIEDDIQTLDKEKWGINEINIPQGFDYYLDLIRDSSLNIKPELDLILRHSSGVLFQEAQKEVLFFNPQKDLFGGVSSKLKTSENLYSSIHYTPPYLSRTIVENALHNCNLNSVRIKVFDPACGSSEFLIETLKQLKELNYSGNVEILGWDSSETAINTSKFLLQYEKRTIWKDRLNYNIKLVEDSLIENWDNDYDLILMNPPFVSWELLKYKKNRDAVKDALGDTFIGKRPNQASAFFYKSIIHLSENGVIGCVLPSSILNLDSYNKLRRKTSDQISIKLLGRLGNFVFEDALTDVSLFIGKKPKTTQSPKLIWTRNEKGIAQNALRDLRKMNYTSELTVDDPNYSIYKPISFPILQENWKPLSIENNNLLKNIERFILEKRLSRTGEIFAVRQGIRHGAKNVFKLNKDEFESLPDNEKVYFRPVIDNYAVKNGTIHLRNYIWYPYDRNGINISTEDELKNSVPEFYRSNLKPKEDILKNRSGIKEWWSLTRPRNWQFEKSTKLISTEFGKSGSFALDKSGNYVVERGNAWISKKEFNKSDYYFYLALFCSPFFDKLLSIYSKQLLSGWDIGKKYTKDIPIPNVKSDDVAKSDGYSKLVQIGKELSEGNSYVRSISDEILIKYFYPHS